MIEIKVLLTISLLVCLAIYFFYLVHKSFRNNEWVTVYECPCGEEIENGVGARDEYFFLDDVCPKCGEEKDEFERKGKAQIKVGFFKEEYQFREKQTKIK